VNSDEFLTDEALVNIATAVGGLRLKAAKTAVDDLQGGKNSREETSSIVEDAIAIKGKFLVSSKQSPASQQIYEVCLGLGVRRYSCQGVGGRVKPTGAGTSTSRSKVPNEPWLPNAGLVTSQYLRQFSFLSPSLHGASPYHTHHFKTTDGCH